MKRSTLVFCAVLIGVVLASFFAPAPVTRTVHADQRNACPGLTTAYRACREHNPNGQNCQHIWEQLLAHGCYYGSSSSFSS